MDKMFITNQAGERLEVGVVRFFEYNETAFLIYTLSEVDANNYVKLYVTKVNVDNVQSITITEEAEWNLFKEVMKDIIKSNKNNTSLQVTDLEPQLINNIVIYDSKVFKLNSEMVNYLQMNKKVAGTVSEPTVEVNQIPDVFATSQIPSVEEITSQPVLTEEVAPVGDNGINVSIPELPSDMVFNGPSINPMSTLEEASTVLPETNSIPNIEEPVGTLEPLPEINSIVSDVAPVSEMPSMDYEKAYQEEQAEVNELIQKVAELENEINNLNAKLEQIKNIIG